ncbi:MAG: phosphoserine transaminase [Gammaproteobacteria bacterium]|nr:phosphoserine transaminase [Gammaproteobacteria bacterium]MBT5205284.1 phosphoserine transaminase [Gammaproteobacteria bacterium]MBT5602604.1 phosphoserine transaminase [Gammaproteobacteria bacterium]MBT6245798.1 phosphoserine transaminase [Gammaproteobacteria bacterium]
MRKMIEPATKPGNPCFSSGPTSKYPGWNLTQLNTSNLGRSHRAPDPKAQLRQIIEDSKEILQIPDDYRLGIVPASDTGAFEMAMWTMLGQRGTDVLSWESFGQGWRTDIEKQLRLTDVNYYSADYGSLPDLALPDSVNRDIVFTWNGTTSGVKVANGDWIDSSRDGLTFCDATSAAFAMHLPWQKLDVITWSWQKVMGGEGAHGMLALSPKAVARLESYQPSWPLPKIFRLTKSGKLIEGLFQGATINTPSMLAAEDHLMALQWAKSIGGIDSLVQRSEKNLAVISEWVNRTKWVDFLAVEPETRSSTSICLKIVDAAYSQLSEPDQRSRIKAITQRLESNNIAYDIAAYRDAPPGLRIWGGATVQSSDLQCLTQWLDWVWQVTG